MAGSARTRDDDRAASDGRLQRSVRSRELIIEALLELIQEGDLLPTGEQVAARAGVGLRTVFRHFEDMETLHSEIHERVEAMVRPMLEPIPAGSLEARIGAFARQRAGAFERMAPFKRSGDIQRWRSPFIQGVHESMVRDLRANLREILPEVDALPAPERHIVESLTSYETWNRLRVDQGLGKERAQEAVRAALTKLLAG